MTINKDELFNFIQSLKNDFDEKLTNVLSELHNTRQNLNEIEYSLNELENQPNHNNRGFFVPVGIVDTSENSDLLMDQKSKLLENIDSLQKRLNEYKQKNEYLNQLSVIVVNLSDSEFSDSNSLDFSSSYSKTLSGSELYNSVNSNISDLSVTNGSDSNNDLFENDNNVSRETFMMDPLLLATQGFSEDNETSESDLESEPKSFPYNTINDENRKMSNILTEEDCKYIARTEFAKLFRNKSFVNNDNNYIDTGNSSPVPDELSSESENPSVKELVTKLERVVKKLKQCAQFIDVDKQRVRVEINSAIRAIDKIKKEFS